MCKNLLLNNVYDYLSRHASEIEKKRELIIKNHYAEETQECINFQSFFKDYLAYINNYISTTNVETSMESDYPFVIIGSTVDVYDIDNSEECQYQIVMPYSEQNDVAVDYASCLSPLGKSLLFKSLNENVKIQIPAGTLNYRIKKISLPDY